MADRSAYQADLMNAMAARGDRAAPASRVRPLEASRAFSQAYARQRERRIARELRNIARVTGNSAGYRTAARAERDIAVAGRSRDAGALSTATPAGPARVWVEGFTKKDGTRVPGHWRTNPNPAQAEPTPLMQAVQSVLSGFGPSTYTPLGPAVNIDGGWFWRNDKGELIAAGPGDVLDRRSMQIMARQERRPFPEAHERSQGVGIAGKVLGLMGLDASGQRARTSWSEAWQNTQATSLLNMLQGGFIAGERGVRERRGPELDRESAALAMEAAGTLMMSTAPGVALAGPRGALGSAGGRPPRTTPAPDLDQLGLYSRLGRAIDELPERGTPRDMLNRLDRILGPESLAAREEMRWTGVRQMLEERAAAAERSGANSPNRITRDEIRRHFDENRIRIARRRLEGEFTPNAFPTDRSRFSIESDRTVNGRREITFFIEDQVEEQITATVSSTGRSVLVQPEFSRPFRLMLPTGRTGDVVEAVVSRLQTARMMGADSGPHYPPTRYESYSLALPDNPTYREDLFQWMRPGEAQSLLAIQRLEQEAARAPADKVLAADKAVERAMRTHTSRYPRLPAAHHTEMMRGLAGGHVRAFELPGVRAPDGRIVTAHHNDELQNDWAQRYRGEAQSGTAPPAPFVGNTSDWVDFQLSTQLIEAARNPRAQAMTVISGEEVARRFDQAGTAEAVYYNPETRTFLAEMRPGEVAQHINVTPEQLQRMIGEENASRLLNAPYVSVNVSGIRGSFRRTWGPIDFISRNGLGNVNFYNTIVRRRLNRLVRSVDPDARVEVASAPTINSDGTPGTVPVMYVEMTPRLRERLVNEGLPFMSNPPAAAGAGAVAADAGTRAREAQERASRNRALIERMRQRVAK